MAEARIPARIMIDCSHGNSGKEPEKQVEVGLQVSTQIADGDTRIFGVMIESHLKAGR
jgi:3-deoxy-7-phosphoheptulonate synthase